MHKIKVWEALHYGNFLNHDYNHLGCLQNTDEEKGCLYHRYIKLEFQGWGSGGTNFKTFISKSTESKIYSFLCTVLCVGTYTVESQVSTEYGMKVHDSITPFPRFTIEFPVGWFCFSKPQVTL